MNKKVILIYVVGKNANHPTFDQFLIENVILSPCKMCKCSTWRKKQLFQISFFFLFVLNLRWQNKIKLKYSDHVAAKFKLAIEKEKLFFFFSNRSKNEITNELNITIGWLFHWGNNVVQLFTTLDSFLKKQILDFTSNNFFYVTRKIKINLL